MARATLSRRHPIRCYQRRETSLLSPLESNIRLLPPIAWVAVSKAHRLGNSPVSGCPMAPAIVCLGGRGLIATSSATAARTPPVCVPLPPLPSPLSIYGSRFRFGHTLLSAYDTVKLTPLKTSTSNFISLNFLFTYAHTCMPLECSCIWITGNGRGTFDRSNRRGDRRSCKVRN